jgi:hypothetical protein
MKRRLIAAGFLAVAACAALTACGDKQPAAGGGTTAGTAPSTTGPTTTSPPARPTSGAADPATSTRCTAATLSGKVAPTDAGAGNRYGKFVVTNTGAKACTLNGYSGFQLLDAAGGPIPTSTDRKPDPAPALVTLAPGASAAANLHWSVVPHGDEPQSTPCQPEAPNAQAIPPDETQPISFPWGIGPVCGGGRIEISAFYPA